MKNIFHCCFRFLVKLICFIAIGSASIACYLLKFVARNNYSPASNQLCNHLLELFSNVHMLLNYLLLVDQESFVHQS